MAICSSTTGNSRSVVSVQLFALRSKPCSMAKKTSSGSPKIISSPIEGFGATVLATTAAATSANRLSPIWRARNLFAVSEEWILRRRSSGLLTTPKRVEIRSPICPASGPRTAASDLSLPPSRPCRLADPGLNGPRRSVSVSPPNRRSWDKSRAEPAQSSNPSTSSRRVKCHLPPKLVI